MADKRLLNQPQANSGPCHYYHPELYYTLPNINKRKSMDGLKRVIAFCILIIILPLTLIIIPLYLRKSVYADVIYSVADSDVIEIRDGISSIFCQQHSLHMTTSFNAFQLRNKPEISSNRKHIRLKKSMTLPDDTLEYWGFYLLKGAKVHLKFCSRYDGSRILVVKGQRDLKTCGLLDHNKNKVGTNFAHGHEQVKVFFEDITEINEYGASEHHVGLIQNDNKDVNRMNNDDDGLEAENNGGEIFNDNDTDMTENQFWHKSPKRSVLSHPLKAESVKINTNKAAEISLSNKTTLQESRKPYINENLKRNLPDKMRVKNNSSQQPKNDIDNTRVKSTKQFPTRIKRELIYNLRYSHGGNAVNYTGTDESSSISSFENGLLDCYNGDILLSEGFSPASDCTNAHFLENVSHRIHSQHEVTEDGYYYYIFYSDNDLVRNDIHAIFDIYKPTFQYSNISDSRACVNMTKCTFPISFFSNEIVIVEVPTRDGIEYQEDDITDLISTCHPRTGIYAIFPISALILILSFSFL